MTIQEQLKEFRFKNGLTQKKLSEMLGCRQSQLSKWERGKTVPSKLRMEIINKVIGVDNASGLGSGL